MLRFWFVAFLLTGTFLMSPSTHTKKILVSPPSAVVLRDRFGVSHVFGPTPALNQSERR